MRPASAPRRARAAVIDGWPWLALIPVSSGIAWLRAPRASAERGRAGGGHVAWLERPAVKRAALVAEAGRQVAACRRPSRGMRAAGIRRVSARSGRRVSLPRALWFGSLWIAEHLLRERLARPRSERIKAEVAASERALEQLRLDLADDPVARETRIAAIERHRLGRWLSRLVTAGTLNALPNIVSRRTSPQRLTVVERLAGVALVRG